MQMLWVGGGASTAKATTTRQSRMMHTNRHSEPPPGKCGHDVVKYSRGMHAAGGEIRIRTIRCSMSVPGLWSLRLPRWPELWARKLAEIVLTLAEFAPMSADSGPSLNLIEFGPNLVAPGQKLLGPGRIRPNGRRPKFGRFRPVGSKLPEDSANLNLGPSLAEISARIRPNMERSRQHAARSGQEAAVTL